MASLNKVLLIGNIGKDADLRYSANGIPVSSFPLAVNKVYNNAAGERQEKTTWINVVLFGKTAETLKTYLHSGRQVFIDGELNIEKYTDKDGVIRYATKVIGRFVQLLGKKDDKEESELPVTESSQEIPPSTEIPSSSIDDIPF